MGDSSLTQDSLDRFLHWLHPERDQAGQTYEKVRQRLIVFFNCRGCLDTEELADRTINRVISQIDELVATYKGDPTRYFHGVARYIHLEYLKEKGKSGNDPVSDAWPDSSRPEEQAEREQIAGCLEECLETLSDRRRELFVRYYQIEGQAKVDHRLTLAKELGYSLTALRLQIHRLCKEMRSCITSCQQRTADA